MDNIYSPRSLVLRQLQNGPFGPHMKCLDEAVVVKLQQFYQRKTLQRQVRLLAKFGDWSQAQGTSLFNVTDATLNEFLLRNPQLLRQGSARLAREVLHQLRDDGFIAAQEYRQSPSEQVVEEFFRYLQSERGLANKTIKEHTRLVARFLEEHFGAEDVCFSALGVQEIVNFILNRVRRKLWVQDFVAALRSFFRFLLVRGRISTDLAAAIPTPARWRWQSLPRGLEAREVESLLRHCSRKTPVGRRNHAILLILARLGLRGGEVVNLQLEDLDWEAGEITVRSKGRRGHRLPLPDDVGRAIASYLKNGRPPTTSRNVFVRCHPPFREFRTPSAICAIVEGALRKAGLHPPRKGAHNLRHALATNMLRNGASLSEIGQVLRHRRADTTRIYAKVDVEALKSLAMPWPGGVA